jgi:cell division septal protein FtsQ
LREKTPKAAGVKSKTVKRRQVFRYLRGALTGIFLVGLVGGFALWVGSQLRDDGKAVGLVDSKPLAEIRFQSNGVLSEAWLSRQVRVKNGTRLIEVDIHGIKTKLEAVGQVASASVQRELPDTLRIRLVEHKPVLRLVIENVLGQKELKLVSRNGTVFSGIDQELKQLRTLPYLGPHRYPDGSYLPLRGIEKVAQLLDICREDYPEEYALWDVVLLTHYSGEAGLPGEVIELRAEEGDQTARLIFGGSLDFKMQLDRLRHIREVAQGLGDRLQRVDLSLRDAAAVQFRSGRNKLL